MRKTTVVAIGLGICLAFAGHFWRLQAQVTGHPSGEPQIVMQSNTPSWYPPGSIWVVTTNWQLRVQTNNWNQNITRVYSNVSRVYVSGTNTFTNILVSVSTGSAPSATWVLLP